MTETSLPWTESVGDGTPGGYTALVWSEFHRALLHGGDEDDGGVLRGFGNELAVTGTASPLAVNTGAALVYGKFYKNSASENLAVTTPVVGTTGGHVILRLDWTAATVRLVAVRNTDGVAGIPALTQSVSTQWEIRLASFTITTGGVITLTDARVYLHPSFEVITAMLAADSVTDAKLRNSAAVSVMGRAANSSGDPADIAAGANDRVLRRVSDALDFGQLTAGMIPSELVTAAMIANRTRTIFVPAVFSSEATPSYGGSGQGFVLPDAGTSGVWGQFYVPADFASAMTVQGIAIPDLGSGNLRWRLQARYGAANEAYNAHTADTGLTTSACVGDEREFLPSTPLSLASIAAGDQVLLEFTRAGADAADTLNGLDVFCPGFLVSYTADS